MLKAFKRRKIAKSIKYFFTDIDGSLTDGTVAYTDAGELEKRFNLKDGTGFFLLRKSGIEAGFLTGENTQIVVQRAKKLQLNHCFIGISNKLECLHKFAASKNISLSQIAYLGDDLNDHILIGKVGIFFCPKDASEYIKKCDVIVCKKEGGKGALRDAVEKLLKMRGEEIIEIFYR